jgi:hypothetical protein
MRKKSLQAIALGWIALMSREATKVGAIGMAGEMHNQTVEESRLTSISKGLLLKFLGRNVMGTDTPTSTIKKQSAAITPPNPIVKTN